MNLRDARNKRKLTQEKLAALTGIDQTTISAIECGTLKRPSWQIVARLARVLRMDPEKLFPTNGINQ